MKYSQNGKYVLAGTLDSKVKSIFNCSRGEQGDIPSICLLDSIMESSYSEGAPTICVACAGATLSNRRPPHAPFPIGREDL